jgi:predicted CXXCH cytochrome family protein
MVRAYRNSVHGRALLDEGREDAAGCVECHGAHNVRPVNVPTSTVYKARIPDLCGQCHESQTAEYRRGIHGQALADGIMEAPSCADCHGEHTIASHSDPRSTVAPQNVSTTCGNCHASEGLIDRFGLSTAVVKTYEGSFHGITNRYGRAEAANCSSCHGWHDIRPSSDPESNINPANLPKVCGKCHPNAGVNFARGRVHVEASPESSFGVYVVRQFYTWLIALLGVGFLIHMSLQTWSAIRRRREESGRSK